MSTDPAAGLDPVERSAPALRASGSLDAEAAALDAADPLAHHRAAFVGAETSLVYFDGNSLGRPPRASADRLARFVTDEWGGRLIRGWDERWMNLPFTVGDRIGALCLGAATAQTVIGDSTTVLLYKLLRAALEAQTSIDPARIEIVVGRDDFPTDRYLVEGIAAERGARVVWIDVDTSRGVDADLLRAAVGPRTAVVLLSHVSYRSGFLADGPALTAIAHDAGALVLWDLCHSAGAVTVDLDGWGADLAVGCTYKYLNGGPGSPAFAYVAARHQATLVQPVQGWMGAADVFSMGPRYRPAEGMRRFLSGTPPVLAMIALQDTLDLLERAGIAAVRRKSVALTEFAVRVADGILAPLGVHLASPRDPAERGGHVTLSHPSMRAVTARLWTDDILPDYRDPHGLRIGLSPLSTSFVETLTGLRAVAAAVRAES